MISGDLEWRRATDTQHIGSGFNHTSANRTAHSRPGKRLATSPWSRGRRNRCRSCVDLRRQRLVCCDVPDDAVEIIAAVVARATRQKNVASGPVG